MMSSLFLPRTAIALVWIYQGFWCKLLGHAPHHQKIVESTPFFNSSLARPALLGLGLFECALAAWVVSGIRAREAAVVQTVLLVFMNTAGILWARSLISDTAGMLLQNFAFLLLAWVAAGELGCYAGV
jgi:uncharacterized membrane protein YphA (DoxX/SURF4 family)